MKPSEMPEPTPTSYRLQRSQRVLPLVPLLFSLVAVVGPSLAIRGRMSGFSLVTALVEMVAFAGALILTQSVGVDLEEDGALLRGLRRRRVRWDDVRSVEVQFFFGTQVVVLVERDRRNKLRAPVTGFLQRDKGFDEKVEAIRWWWATHRSFAAGPPDDLATLTTPPRTRSQVAQLILSIVLATYVAFVLFIVLLLLVTGSILHALLVSLPSVVLIGVICALEPSKPAVQRWVRRRRHR